MDGAKQLYMETTAAVERETRRGLSDEDWHARSGPGRTDDNGDAYQDMARLGAQVFNGQAPPASAVDELRLYHQGDPGDETEAMDHGSREWYERFLNMKPGEIIEAPPGYFSRKRPAPRTSDEIVQALSRHMKDAPERQLERRRAWSMFAAAFASRYPNTQAAEEADKLLAEYDRRFGA